MELTAPQQFHSYNSTRSMSRAFETARAELSKFFAFVFKVQPG
jgi:hypothetical protein